MESPKIIKIAFVFLFIFTLLIFIYGLRREATGFLGSDFLKKYLPLDQLSKIFILPKINLVSNPSSGGSSSNNNQTSGTAENKPKFQGTLPVGFRESDLSSYYSRFSFSVSASSNPSSYPESFRLGFNSLEKGERIDISGWRVQANRGAFIISQGAEYFEPVSGGAQSDIIITNPVTVNVYSSSNTIKVNFRSNKCIGYVSKMYNFNPSISGSCPSLNRSDYYYLPGDCQNYISSASGSCEDPAKRIQNYNYISDECKSVLNRLNYTGCYDDHKKDNDFLGGDWYVWAGQSILDSLHDRVLVFDRASKLVAEYTY